MRFGFRRVGPPTASYKSVYDTYEILVRCILHKPNSAPSYVLQLCHKSALNLMKSPFLVLKSTFSYCFRGPTWCFVKQSRGFQLPVFLPILAGEIPHPASCLTIIGLGYPADRFACKVRLILTSLSEAKFGEAAKKKWGDPKRSRSFERDLRGGRQRRNRAKLQRLQCFCCSYDSNVRLESDHVSLVYQMKCKLAANMQVKGNWMQTTTFEETESVILLHACLMILMIGVVLWDSGKWLAE